MDTYPNLFSPHGGRDDSRPLRAMTSSRLELDSALKPDGEAAFTAELSPDWCIAHTPNGGYLMSVVLRAMGRVLPFPDPVTATAHYCVPAETGPATVKVEVIRTGRTLARGVGRLLQHDVERLRVVAAFGRLPEVPQPLLYGDDRPFVIASLERCRKFELGTPDGGSASVRSRFDTYYDPSSVGWASDRPTREPQLKAWVRSEDGSQADRYSLPVMIDALPSTAFELGVTGWVPTIELTIHQRAVPAPGWLKCGFRGRQAGNGLFDEDGEVWDSAGHLVAISRQLAALPETFATDSHKAKA